MDERLGGRALGEFVDVKDVIDDHDVIRNDFSGTLLLFAIVWNVNDFYRC